MKYVYIKRQDLIVRFDTNFFIQKNNDVQN